MALARAPLARTDGWGAAWMHRIVRAGRTVRARLDTPAPLRIVCRTSWLDGGGTVQVRPDIYGRDADLARRMATADGS